MSSARKVLPEQRVPEWAQPVEMNKTYAFLYNPMVVCNTPYLPMTMDRELWRLVYGTPAVRNRSMCWAYAYGDSAEARAFAYAPRRTTEENVVRQRMLRQRIESMRASEDLQSEMKRRMIEHEQAALAAAQNPRAETFVRPPRSIHLECGSGTGRSFEVQCNDAYLCGMHTFNNVANSVVLSPPDLLQAIELVRPLNSRYASPEELMLAALREGVFLLPVRLTHASDLNALDEAEPHPRRKYCLQLLKKAGGMLVYQPSSMSLSKAAVGHYVSLVYTPRRADDDDESGWVAGDATHDWCVYSTDHIVSHSANAADALDNYFFTTLAAGIDQDLVNMANEEREREKRRQMLLQQAGGEAEGMQFIGLLPISLSLLQNDARLGPQFEASREDTEWLYILRSLVRRSLSAMRASETADQYGVRDISMPTPISPGNLDVLSDFMCANVVERACLPTAPGAEASSSSAQSSETAQDDKARTRFDGFDTINAASVLSTRYVLDEDLNRCAEELANVLMSIIVPPECAQPIDIVEELWTVLRTLRSRLRELPAIAMLMVVGDNFEKSLRLVSNRRWFRYVALHITVTQLIVMLKACRSGGAVAPELLRVLVLFCFVTYSSMANGGVKLSTWPAIEELFGELGTARHELLPLDDDTLPANIADVARNGAAVYGRGSKFALLMLHNSYDVTLWLMRATAKLCGGDGAALPHELFELESDVEVDDLSARYDRALQFISTVRRTLFALPLAGKDFNQVERLLPPQRLDEPTSVTAANHFCTVAIEFRNALTGEMAPDELRHMIDAIGFDANYLPRDGEQPDAYRQRIGALRLDTSTHSLKDKRKPRFVERMMQLGVPDMYRHVFGILYTRADERVPIVDNIERLPLPRQPGNWMSTGPRTNEAVLLKTAPLSELPTLRQASRESTRFALHEDDRSWTQVPAKRSLMPTKRKTIYAAPTLSPAPALLHL